MNYFEAQDSARRTSKWLIVVYVVVTALIVAAVTFTMAPAYIYISTLFEHVFSNTGQLYMPSYAQIPRESFVFVAVLTTSIILGASLYKRRLLNSGGGRIVAAFGGTPL